MKRRRASLSDLRKWSYPSYFLFLSAPGTCMFMLRERIDAGLDIAGYPLQLATRPDRAGYAGVLAFSGWLLELLRHLGPRDMIDVQSFIWYMAAAPTRA